MAGIHSSTADGATVYPSWDLLLSFETALRKAAFKQVKSGASLARSLKAVYVDGIFRELRFITPFRLQDRYKASSSAVGSGTGSASKGGGKFAQQYLSGPAGHAPARSYSQGKPAKSFGKSAEGRRICYAYRNRDQYCEGESQHASSLPSVHRNWSTTR